MEELDEAIFNVKERIIMKIFKKTFQKFYNYVRIEIINNLLQ